jgi:general secretion pathway protein F
MKSFSYKCFDDTGTVQEGEMTAESRDGAVAALFARGWHVVRVDEKDSEPTGMARLPFWKVITGKSLMQFSRQAGRLLHSGLPLTEVLSTLRDQIPVMNPVLGDVLSRILRGDALHLALGAHPGVFSPLYVSLIRSAESSGHLESGFNRLAELLEEEQGNRSAMTQALAYPLSVVLIGMVTVFAFTSFVLPRFTMVFEHLGGELPVATQVLVALSTFFGQWWWFFVLAALVLVLVLRQALKKEKGRRFRDRFMLKLPFIGSVVRELEVAHFSRTLGAQLEAGLPILAALDVSRKTTQNVIFREAVSVAMESVRKGGKLSEEIRRSGLFPPSAASLIVVAEQGGELPKALLDIADDATRESARRIAAVLTLMEPLLIVLVGAVVGALVIAMLLPIFNLEEMLQ